MHGVWIVFIRFVLVYSFVFLFCECIYDLAGVTEVTACRNYNISMKKQSARNIPGSACYININNNKKTRRPPQSCSLHFIVLCIGILFGLQES